MSILVIILNKDTKECDPNITKLKTRFADPYYKVEIMKDYRDALKFAEKKHPSIPCLIIKDNSIITHDITSHLEKVLALKADIHFLCTWGDLCYRYTSCIENIKWTTDSCTSQAVLYMPQIRKTIIRQLKKSPIEKILKYLPNKTVFIPNIVHFDIDLATCNEDYLKMNGSLPMMQDDQTQYNNQLIWIFIIIIVIILLSLLIPYYKKHRQL